MWSAVTHLQPDPQAGESPSPIEDVLCGSCPPQGAQPLWSSGSSLTPYKDHGEDIDGPPATPGEPKARSITVRTNQASEFKCCNLSPAQVSLTSGEQWRFCESTAQGKAGRGGG